MPSLRTHLPPATCPVCSQALITLRLGCPECGTEVSGHFDTCRYCRLDAADLAILEVFLRSRGNVRDVQAHLGVSYPTARARLGEVLDRVGLGGEPPGAAAPATRPLVGLGPGSSAPPGAAPAPAPGTDRPPASPDAAAVLADLAAGRIDVATAELLLAGG
jgi:hypothetical protein